MKIFPLLSLAIIPLLPARTAAQSQLQTIYKFAGPPDGAAPQGLAAGPNGTLYGMTANGGSFGYGTVFQLTPPSSPHGQWSESILYEFTDSNSGGTNPYSAPVVGKDGSIYGATGGAVSTIFQLQPPAAPGGDWTETVLYPPEVESTAAGFNHGLVVGPNGELYATASIGGFYGCGAVVGLTPPSVPGKWSVTMQYDFPGGDSGCKPAGVALSADGVIYGVTTYGGTSGQGVIFALTPTAAPYVYTETVLYNFTGGDDGGFPAQPPILAPPQFGYTPFAIYGTTPSGGAAGLGGVFYLIWNFASGTWGESFPFHFQLGNGGIPGSALLEVNSVFYGVTANGYVKSDAGGSVFQLSPDPPYLTETVLHKFPGPAGPSGNLVMTKNGILYGTTVSGGPAGFGTVYRIKP